MRRATTFTRNEAAIEIREAYEHGLHLGRQHGTTRPHRSLAWDYFDGSMAWADLRAEETIRGFDVGRAQRDDEIKAVIHGSPWPAPDGHMTPSVTPDPRLDFGGAA